MLVGLVIQVITNVIIRNKDLVCWKATDSSSEIFLDKDCAQESRVIFLDSTEHFEWRMLPAFFITLLQNNLRLRILVVPTGCWMNLWNNIVLYKSRYSMQLMVTIREWESAISSSATDSLAISTLGPRSVIPSLRKHTCASFHGAGMLETIV